MDKFIQIFIDFIPYDKEFVEELMPKYEAECRTLGGYIENHSTSLSCMSNEFMEELVDFLDGNGFEVIRPRVNNPYDTHPIQLSPIYEIPTEPIYGSEIKKEIDKLNEAIKKIQSTFSEYVPVQETVLYYTSMENNQRYILEYKKFLASWAFWLRVCRRVELLRLVSEGRCGSAPVPRPP